MTRSRFVKISFIISILIQIGFESFGQIGNEWYNPSQSYFKFKIGQKGIYRLNYNTLSNHGIQIDDIDPKTIKIFKNGVEQYIFVSGQDDNRFAQNDIEIDDTDIIVIPEAYGPQINEVFPSHSKVIYNQGCYLSLGGFPLRISIDETPYLQKNTLATLVNSDDAVNYLKLAFKDTPVFKIHHFIDTKIFKPITKKKQIAYMSRKNFDDIKQVIQINALRKNLDNWQIIDLN